MTFQCLGDVRYIRHDVDGSGMDTDPFWKWNRCYDVTYSRGGFRTAQCSGISELWLY